MAVHWHGEAVTGNGRSCGRPFLQTLSFVEGVVIMTQMMQNMRAALAPKVRAPAEIARYVVGSAIVIGGAAELVSQALHAITAA
ncbi:hypothetical protein [Burkholderia cepacia]|uniref:hypothetical protein n=2 Tax=Burkholderia cepacia TaxID=292 RepID=UPI0012D89F54|nr:hypothetical protein [Burkholderia cepacia]